MIVGFTMLVFTMAAMVIIDHFGRRKLMLVGSIGYIVEPERPRPTPFYAEASGRRACCCWRACWCSSPRTASARER